MDNEIVINDEPGYRISQKMRIALVAHFENGVPIDRLGVMDRTKDMIAQVDHVYWLFVKNPMLDVHALFYQMAKGQAADGYGRGRCNAHHKAKFLEKILDEVLEIVKPPSRKKSELKVRAIADKLMRIGCETDNDRALAKSADITMRLDRLDQPENEQADMSKVAFLPSVVTTNITDVDDTKEDIDDEETKRIVSKYNAYVDDKRTLIEQKVAAMEANSESKVKNQEFAAND